MTNTNDSAAAECHISQYNSRLANKPLQATQARSDLAVGAQRGRETARDAKQKLQDDSVAAEADLPKQSPSPQFGERVESFRADGSEQTVDNVKPPM